MLCVLHTAYFESKTPKKLRFPVEIYQKSIDIHDLSICFLSLHKIGSTSQNYGQTDQGATPSLYGFDTREGYQAGDSGEEVPVLPRVSLSAESSSSAWSS